MTSSGRGAGRAGEGWRSPAGLSALAAAVGTLVAVVALFLSFRGDEPDEAGSPATGSGSPSPSPSASTSATTEADGVELPAVTGVEQIVGGVRTVSQAVLPGEETAGGVERRGVEAVNADFPTQWGDGGVAPWLADDSDDSIGTAIQASTDISRFYAGEAAGFFVGVSSLAETDPEAMLENVERGWETSCVRVGENTIEGRAGTGHYEVYRDCDPAGSVVVEVATKGDYSMYLHARLTDTAHVDYLQALLESLDVTPPVPTGAPPA